MRDLRLFRAGELGFEELSSLWGLNLKVLVENYPEPGKALLKAMDEAEKRASALYQFRENWRNIRRTSAWRSSRSL